MTRHRRDAPSDAEVARVLTGIAQTLHSPGPGIGEECLTWLRWEHEHPEAVYLPPGLPEHSVWTLKQLILRRLCRTTDLMPYQDELTDLVIGAVRRRQEAYDGWYSRLALRLDGPRLRSALSTATHPIGAEARPPDDRDRIHRRRQALIAARWATDR